jgi:cysteine desulfurase
LDYNSTTPVRAEVEEAMRPFARQIYANAASRHSAGQEAWSVLEKARERIADLVGASADDVIFTSGAMESNFLALLGRFEYLIQEGCRPSHIRVAVSALEHPCVIACAKEMRRRGAKVHDIPATAQGVIALDFFNGQKPYDIVSVMAANHETGAIQPLADIAARLDAKTTFFHTDAAQWAGRIEGSMDEWNVSAISLSAHKMYGPKGIGALIVRQGTRLLPIFPGSQEAGMRGGTVNVAGAVGFGVAVEFMKKERKNEATRLYGLREMLWEKLASGPLELIRTVAAEHSLPNTLHVRLAGWKGERVVAALDRWGICCSSGPACSAGSVVASPVLMAMGLGESEAWEGVRFSMGMETTEEDIWLAGERILHWLEDQAPRDT